MWHVWMSGELQVGFQSFNLTGRKFGRAEGRWENTNIMLRPAILMLTQNAVKQMALKIIKIHK